MSFTIEQIKKGQQLIKVEIGIENKEETLTIKIDIARFKIWMELEGRLNLYEEIPYMKGGELDYIINKGKVTFREYWKLPELNNKREMDVYDYIVVHHYGEIQKEINKVSEEMINDYKNN
jgi:hypothetical protein